MKHHVLVISFLSLFFIVSCGAESFRSGAGGGGGLDPHSGNGNGDGDSNSDPDDPNNPNRALVPYTYSESFTGNNQQQLDLLFVVDNSGSMTEEINAVKAQLGNFVNKLQSRRMVDYQVAVTTTNFIAQTRASSDASSMEKLQKSGVAGPTQGKVVAKSATDSDPVQIARDILSSIPFNNTWSGYEMGISGALDVINSVGSTFMRDRVDLAVITLSDEDDHSDPTCKTDVNGAQCVNYARKDLTCPLADGSCPYLDLNAAKTAFQSLNRSVIYKPLVGLASPACSTVATVGKRYTQLASLLGFSSLNICAATSASQPVSPLEQNLINIAESISARGICFPMTVKATGQEIVVNIVQGGTSTQLQPDPSNGYQYDSATNAICFPGSIVIDSSVRIDVSYQSLH